MLFLNIVSMEFNATFPALNKSREVCSIGLEISGHAASLHHLSFVLKLFKPQECQ